MGYLVEWQDENDNTVSKELEKQEAMKLVEKLRSEGEWVWITDEDGMTIELPPENYEPTEPDDFFTDERWS